MCKHSNMSCDRLTARPLMAIAADCAIRLQVGLLFTLFQEAQHSRSMVGVSYGSL